ncbi:hypothetical protein LCGC14_2018150 [marine sediment metagenome]|uniref:histidine kinase n=1 Tax=marine sediment metagenome TaxID=412755 RepID=A0A0F9HVF9_9ZZZZ
MSDISVSGLGKSSVAIDDITSSICTRSALMVAGTLAFFAMLTIATIRIAAALVEQAVERDASRRSLEWTEFAISQAPHIADLAKGLPVLAENWETYQDLANYGGVFRYKIFSPDGVLRFESDDPSADGENLGKHNYLAATVLQSGQPYTVVADGRHKPDRPDLYSETYLPVFDNGRMVAIAETYMDQTSKTAAIEREYAFVGAAMVGLISLALLIPSIGLWVLFRRLRMNNAKLQVSQVRAQASDRAKSEFISTVSHELRTPLTSIRGSLELLSSGKIAELSAPANRLVVMAAKNARILNMLVNDLLDFEKLDTGNLEMIKRSTDLVDLVKDELANIETYEANQDIKYRFTGDENPLRAHVDPDRIAQVVRNLVSNAAKFSPIGGTVEISVRQNDGMVRLEVADTGCGISKDDQGLIFEKFTQVDSSTTRKHSGTGLGLAISKEIVMAHDGEIGVISAVGQGSLFFCNLPIGIQTDDAAAMLPKVA